MDFIEGITSFLVDEVFVRRIMNPLLRDPSYQSGFIWGLATAIAVGIAKAAFDRFVYWGNRILQFFRHTKGPAEPSKGPTPFEMFMKFLSSLVSVVVAIVLLVIIIIVVIRRSM